MIKPPPVAMPPATPAPSLREEIANALSHGLGFLLAAASLPVLLAGGWLPARPGSVLGAAVFALTMMLCFLASTVYHALPPGQAKRWLCRVDHAAIFLFIAGSFTPFALRNLDTTAGLAGFCLVWALALTGIACKAGGRLRSPLRSTLLYVALGWVAAAAAWPTLAVLTARASSGTCSCWPAAPATSRRPCSTWPDQGRGGVCGGGTQPRSTSIVPSGSSHRRDAVQHAQAQRARGVAEVDHAAVGEGPAVVDAHDDLAPVGRVAHARVARDRHRLVRRRHREHVVGLAAARGPAVELAAVPAGQPPFSTSGRSSV
jgi:hemolysin III